MNKNTRRDFLIKAGLGGLSLGLPFASLASALNSVSEDHFFVMIQVSGGMDVTLGLNPLVHKNTDQKDVFLEYRPEDIIKKGNLSFGPSASALAKHSSDLSVVNGIVMRRDVGHESLRDYMSSGSGDGSAQYVNVEFDRLASPSPLGILVDSNILTGNHQPVISQMSLFTAQTSRENQSSRIPFLESLYQRDSALRQTQQNFLNFKKNQVSFGNSLDSIVADLGVERDNVAVIAAAFKSGSSKSAVLNATLMDELQQVDLDTHANHEGSHLDSQAQVWNFISSVFDKFKSIEHKGASLFDSTTFMVVTEFSRTPYLNPAKGKDHNPYTNSVLLAGKGIKGDNTIGESHVVPREQRPEGPAIHIGSPIDYKTGKVVHSATGTGLIFPENVIKSLHQVFSIKKELFYPELNLTKVLPGIAKP